MLHINLDKLGYIFTNQSDFPNDYDEENDKSIVINYINHFNDQIETENEIVFSMISENFNWKYIDEKLIPLLYDIIDLSKKKIYWIIDKIADDNTSSVYYKFKNIKNLLFIDYSALQTYYHIYLAKTCKSNNKWNSNSNLGLFLPGKLHKEHKIVSLCALYKNDLLKKCMYSSYIHDDYKEKIKNIIKI
jgi:hypothetical protein